MTMLIETAPGENGLVVNRCDLWGYNAIGVVSKDEAIAVDPGITPDEITTLREALVAGGARRVHTVLLTHSHHDHIRGWNAFGDATVVAPSVVAAKEEGPRARILAGKSKVDEKLGVDDSSFRYPDVDVTFDERHELRVGELDVLLEFMPGHSNCSSVAVIPELRAILSADYLVTPGLPYCRWEPAPFERAHERLKELVDKHDVELVVPAHNELFRGKDAIHAALDEELEYFRALRPLVEREAATGAADDVIARRCAKAMAERRGVDLGPRARQDNDNARRVLVELRAAE